MTAVRPQLVTVSPKAPTGIAGFDEMTCKPSGNTPLHISTICDIWIHLNDRVQASERNRGPSIVKSRGTEHSNQVRELILSDEGVTLADIYTTGEEVLTGTMRREKKSAERLANEVTEVAGKVKRVTRDAEEAVLQVRALTDNVLMTPTLLKLSPPPVRRIVGALSQMRTVLGTLELQAIAK